MNLEISIYLKPSPPKTKFPYRVYEQPLYPKFYSLSCPTPVPLRTEKYQRKGETETKQDLVRPSQVQKPFCVPHFLSVEQKALAS